MHRPAHLPGASPARATRRTSTRIVAPIAAVVVALCVVAPRWAVECPTKLSNPSVSPDHGSTSTTVTVSVEYRNREGSPADWVRVTVAGSTRAMSQVGGSTWKRGVTFRWSGKLPLGTHP